jgi:hypothetical protein
MAPNGNFVLVNSNPSTGLVSAAFYDSHSVLLNENPIMVNQAPPPACYDMYRFGNTKNESYRGSFIISTVSSGECFSTNHTTVLIIEPFSGALEKILQASKPMQTTAIDGYGSTYMLSSGKILINHYSIL